MSISEELESAIDIVDLVSKYASLKKSGANYKCNCPFPGHNEKTPSFMVSPAKQIAYCFGCHKGGGPIKFVMDIENCEFRDALEILGNYTGIKVNTNFNKEKFEEKKSMYSLYKDASNYYKNALKNYPEIKKYLFDRGLNDDIIRDFSIGYSDSGVELYNYLKSKGYDDEQINESHIFLDLKTKKDKFINRIIFPVQNARGDFVAFAGRIHGSGEPKYLNSPASEIYDKSNILYNLFNARNSITKLDYAIITEGYMDAIALNRGGFTNVVAVSGTALTEKHLVLLKRLTKKIYLCFDGDSAGEKATKLSLEKMKNEGFEVKIILLSGGKDPDEIISSGKDFTDFITNALTPIGYYIKKSNFDTNSIEEKKKLLGELLDIVKSYSDNIEKDFYLKEISSLLNINSNIVYDAFNKIRFTNHESKNKNQEIKQTLTSSEIAIGYCIIDEKNIEYIKKNLIFNEGLGKDLEGFFEKGISYLDSLELSKKEKYKAISLKIESINSESNINHIEEELKKVIDGLNREIFKTESAKLKQDISSGNNDALLKYSLLISKAKKAQIK
ncbi:DNA primase [Candidatus Gracilibacteria bacterium]|nr:DNA primase [Candidatus Gracilibacteria bacterium]